MKCAFRSNRSFWFHMFGPRFHFTTLPSANTLIAVRTLSAGFTKVACVPCPHTTAFISKRHVRSGLLLAHTPFGLLK